MSINGDKWRYRCPEGHTQWRERPDGYYCRQCGESFEELVEAKAAPFHY